MKTIKSLLGMLMLCITTLSYGQDPADSSANDSASQVNAAAHNQSPAPIHAPKKAVEESAEESDMVAQAKEYGLLGLWGTLALGVLIGIGFGIRALFKKKPVGAFNATDPGSPGYDYRTAMENGAAGVSALITGVNGNNPGVKFDVKQKNIKGAKKAAPAWTGVFSNAEEVRVDAKKQIARATGFKRIIGNVDELLAVEERVAYRTTGKKLPWTFWQKTAFTGMSVLLLIFLVGTIMSFMQPHNTTITNIHTAAAKVDTFKFVSMTEPEKTDTITFTNEPDTEPAPQDRIYTHTIDVPGVDENMDRKVTEDWNIPPDPAGWRVRVVWTGNSIWYPRVNDYYTKINMPQGRKLNIGDYNPADMNFSFQSADGEPARVVIYYWKKGSNVHGV